MPTVILHSNPGSAPSHQIAAWSEVPAHVIVERQTAGENHDLWHQTGRLSTNLEAAALAGCGLRAHHAAGSARDGPRRRGPTPDLLYNFHKSLGVLILILMVLRLINRIVAGAPIPDPNIERWQQTVSSAVHGALYVLLVAMPVVGTIANSAYGASTPFFGLFTLPKIIGGNQALATQLFTLHRWTGFLVILLVLLHVGAALYHYFVRRDTVLQRMLPRALGGI